MYFVVVRFEPERFLVTSARPAPANSRPGTGRRSIFSTPTLCSSYIRKCEADHFRRLRHAFVGAEKLREPIEAAFKAKFGSPRALNSRSHELPATTVYRAQTTDSGTCCRSEASAATGTPCPSESPAN